MLHATEEPQCGIGLCQQHHVYSAARVNLRCGGQSSYWLIWHLALKLCGYTMHVLSQHSTERGGSKASTAMEKRLVLRDLLKWLTRSYLRAE